MLLASLFFKRTGYLDLVKVPKVLAENMELRILKGKEIEHQMKMDYYKR